MCPGKKAATVEIKRKLFANKAHNETVETGVVKFDAEEAAEVAILSRDCMRHLGDWYYPEGGWGWVVVTMTLITSVLSSGMLMGGGNIMVSSINKRLDLEADNMTGVMVTTGAVTSVQVNIKLLHKNYD